MTSRRKFLKTITVAAGAPGVLATPASHSQESSDARGPDLPRGATLGTVLLGGEWRLVARTERGILNIEDAGEALDIEAPESMQALLSEGGGKAIEEILRQAPGSSRAARHFYKESELAFGPCITNPEKILCVGLNYRKHAAEMKQPLPKTPLLFNKYNNALMGHRGTLKLPTEVAREFDYEAELVIVIGRTAKNVSEQDALNYVFGYCTGNDFSARDLQRASSQFMLGKSCDGFAPLGPWLVTADQVPDPQTLDISCEVNGERRQASNTNDMVFGCAQLVSYASKHMTLKPGDIMYTGTPEGVIAGMPEGKRAWLKAGDRIRTSFTGLGVLEFSLS